MSAGQPLQGIREHMAAWQAIANANSHWSIAAKFNEKADNEELRKLTNWALPIQQRHFQEALDGSLKLAADEDPDGEAS